MSIIDTLVTDRKAEDVTLLRKKGYYNATDLNRVGEAQVYIAYRFQEIGYAVSVSPKTDWKIQDIPRKADMEKLLSELQELRNILAVMEETPEVPQTLSGLTWREANAIEKILTDLEFLLNNMAETWYFSGELYSGEV